jgi:PAS domain S-box-containing protein
VTARNSGHSLRRPTRSTALDGLVRDGDGVLVLGLEEIGDAAWEILAASGLAVLRSADAAEAVRLVADGATQIVVTDAAHAPELIEAVRARAELAETHVVVCADLGAPDELHAALECGADDVMRIPFEPQVLTMRVATGLRAARLRASESMLRSLIDSIPGAIYRCACDLDWTMELLSDEIEEIVGYPASDFIDNAVRTFQSIEHPDDREYVAREVMKSVETGRPFALEYRLLHRDGSVRWVLERGLAQEAGDGRWWLDGAIFDITARREAEQALREHEVVEAQLAEVRASRSRILDAADRARRDIERNLHDGAQQRLVSVALDLRVWLAQHRDLPDDCRAPVLEALDELGAGLGELRDLARGLHPAVLSDHGLEHALRALAQRAAVPVELDTRLPKERLPRPVEAAAYFAVSEALTNVARYADASHARVCLEERDGELDITVDDDGVGGAELGVGSGLQGLHDRLAALNGTLTIESPAGSGTRLRARLPTRDVPTGGLAGPPQGSWPGSIRFARWNLNSSASVPRSAATGSSRIASWSPASMRSSTRPTKRFGQASSSGVPPGPGRHAQRANLSTSSPVSPPNSSASSVAYSGTKCTPSRSTPAATR